jgi:hypothetical protein
VPRFKVVERRCYDATYIIDAANEKDASHLVGDVVSEDEGESWGSDLLSVEVVDGGDGDDEDEFFEECER